MKFESKISGTMVTDFEITPIFDKQIILLSEVMANVHKQETMNWILDTLRFMKCNENYPNEWYCVMDWDTIFKITVLEKYPEYEKEFINYFGENWMNHYIRFNH